LHSSVENRKLRKQLSFNDFRSVAMAAPRERSVHTGEVQGSIPCASTIQGPYFQRLFEFRKTANSASRRIKRQTEAPTDVENPWNLWQQERNPRAIRETGDRTRMRSRWAPRPHQFPARQRSVDASLTLKDAAILLPIVASSLAVSWEVGRFIPFGGFFLFNLSEHLLAAMAYLPTAITFSVAGALLIRISYPAPDDILVTFAKFARLGKAVGKIIAVVTVILINAAGCYVSIKFGQLSPAIALAEFVVFCPRLA
jgi:hypothetical protein